MKNILLPLAVMVLLAGCSSANKEKAEQLDKEIMRVHDEVMPRIGEVLSLRKQIQQQLDSCHNPQCQDTLNKLSYSLTRADAHMMQWMRAYRMPQDNDTALQYLMQQQAEINSVRTDILSGIENAKNYLKKP